MGGMHQNGQQQPQRIDDDVALAPLDPFAAVKAPHSAHVRRLDRLAIDDGQAGTGLTSSLDPYTAPQGIGQAFEEALLGPSSEVIVDGLPGRKALGEHAPLASGFIEVKQGVTEVSRLMFSEGLPLEERFDSLPLGVRQVGAVAWISMILLHGSGAFCEGGTAQNTDGRCFV